MYYRFNIAFGRNRQETVERANNGRHFNQMKLKFIPILINTLVLFHSQTHIQRFSFVHEITLHYRA